MSISLRNNRALNRVLRDSLRARPEQPQEDENIAKTNAPAYTLSTDIPDNYNDSYVKAIPQDPQNTFVYWELPKGQAEGSLFADKGTAHVENHEAVRIGEQLNKHRQQYNAENRLYENSGPRQNYGHDDRHHADNVCRQIFWDDGKQYGFDENRQQHHRNADNGYCQVFWDDGNKYGFDEKHQQHDNGYCQAAWDDGNRCYDNNRRQYSYCQDDIRRLIWNDGGNYAAYRHDDDAFSEMLSALLARCNQYIADYRRSESNPLAYAISSGLLCGSFGGQQP